jgi:hypothetical protein
MVLGGASGIGILRFAQDDSKDKARATARTTATASAKVNAGILRFAQNDTSFLGWR